MLQVISNNFFWEWIYINRTGNDTSFTFPITFSTICSGWCTENYTNAGGDANIKSLSETGGIIRCTVGGSFYIFGIGLHQEEIED